MCEPYRSTGLDYVVHNLRFKIMQLMWDFSNYMVCATPLRGHIQHLWKTVNLLHPLLIRVLLLILERWGESYHLVFTGRMYKNPINSFHVLEQQSKKGPAQQLSLLGGDSFIPEDIMGISGIILTVLVFISFSYLSMLYYC